MRKKRKGMSSYLIAAENWELKASAEDALNALIEDYTYSFKKARQILEKYGDAQMPHEAELEFIECNGHVQACGDVLMVLLGGGQFYDFWLSTLNWAGGELK